MSGDRTAEFIYLVAILVFVASALMVRKIPIGQGLRMFAGWVLIFLAAFVAFQMKDDIVGFANQVLDERRAESTGLEVGGNLEIKQAREDVGVHISKGFGDTNVLGMNFLSSLSGWGVERNRLILKP